MKATGLGKMENDDIHKCATGTKKGKNHARGEEEQRRGQILLTVRRKEAAQKCNRTRSEPLGLFILVNTPPRI